ncbi:MAG TPA: transcriptional regulator MraZ [Methylothermaceae bacterium]|nr:transcriptional regulator MraZ [Methylothermaceae bacterium]
MFRGLHSLNLDGKGRLAIPARYRDALEADHQGQIVVTIAVDNRCLWLYPWTQWQALEQQLLSLPTVNRHSRRLQRLLIGHAQECQLDGQGRILLNAPLRKYANLNKSVVLVGVGNKLEIWEEKAWEVRRNVWLEEETLEDLPDAVDLSTLPL